jgi:hypothetical protein
MDDGDPRYTWNYRHSWSTAPYGTFGKTGGSDFTAHASPLAKYDSQNF